MITGANGSERSTKAQKQYDSIKATTSSTSSKVAAANALAQSQGKARTEAEQKRAAASSTASTKTETSTGSDKSSSSSSKKSSKSSGSSSSSSQNQRKKELSKEEKSSILKSMLNDATVGNSRTYGLSFQSTANKQIQDSYDSRRQTLVEQATRNGYIKNEEKVAAANALAQQQGMARTQAELARKKANQVIKDQVQGVYRTLGEQARENLSGLDQAQGYRRTQNEIQRYQTAAEQVKKQKNILYDQERGMRRTSQELARQINQLEEEMANQHGRDYQFDENGKAIGVKSLKELQNQLEDLQEKKASVDNESALTRAQAALTRLDSKTRELLAQMNRGGESNSNETRMHGDTAHNATREAAKKQLLQMGYSEDQVERLAEYEQRLQDYTDAMSRMQSMQEFADKNFLTGALATAASAALSPLKAAGNIESIRGILPAALGGYKNEDMPTNIYSPWFFASQSSGALRSGVMQDMGKTGQFLYQVGTSALDSAVNMAVSTGLVGAAGGLSGAATQNAIAKTMNFVMGSEVAADSVYQGIQEGKSNSAALIDGIVEGAIEGFTEEHSVGDILDGMLNGGTIWQKLRNAAISEGSEEVASNWLNRAYDVISRQDKSEVLKAYNGYVEAGKSPAQALAAVVGDFVGEDTVSFLAGGLSGLAMSGAYAGANKVTERFVDPTASAWDQAMLDTMQGIQTPENVTQTRQATATDNAILQTFNEAQNRLAQEVGQKYGLSEDVAQNVVAVANGLELKGRNKEALQTLAKSDAAKAAIQELTGTDVSGNLAESRKAIRDLWASKRPFDTKTTETDVQTETADEAGAAQETPEAPGAVEVREYFNNVNGKNGYVLIQDGKLAAPGFFESYGAAQAVANSINGRNARAFAEAQSRTAPTTPTDVSQNATSTGTQLNIDNTRNNAYNYSTGGVTNGYTDQLDRTSGTGVRNGRNGTTIDRIVQDRFENVRRGNLQFSGIILLSPESQRTLAQRGIVNVELHDSSADNAAFSYALDAARAVDQKNGWAVTPKSADELTQAGTKSYMDSKGSTGFAIAQDGDIEAVFANKAAGAPKGSTKSTIPQAIALGGNKLDCYGAGLVKLYTQYGFVPVARVAFNAEYANDGWTEDKGSPDIYFMMHNGDSADTVVQNMGNYKIWSEADLAALPVMEYDEAYAYRDSLLKQRTSDALQNAREQYGTIPAGENPVREVSLPQSVDGERKVSRFARTAAEAQVTTDEMVERIEQMVADGKLDHSVYSNKQALSDGAKQIEHEYARGKSIEQIRSEFIRDANSGKAGAKFISQGTTLYADAIAEGNYQAAADILVALIAVETNAGRTVQAARLMKSMTPEGRIFTVQKMVSNLEGQINQRRSANNQLELNVPDALLEAYQSATTQDAQQAALDSIYDYIAAEIPTTLREGLRQWRYFSMLANPSTHLKNIKGNISGAIAKIGKDNLAALGETLIIGDKEGRTKAFLNPMSKADQNLLNLSWADYDNAADLFEDSTGKYSQAAGEINDRRRYWKINDPQNSLTRGMDKALGVLEKASDLNSKALEVEDMWFSKPMYSVALAGYMKANHLTEITDAARTYAMTEAKRGTFNDINKVSKWATNLGQNSKIGRFLAGTVYPFKKVPANVMVRTVEYSPLGYLKGLYDLAKMKGNPDITVAQTIDDFAAATTGTALLGIGALLAKHGILRATGVGDDKEKEQQKNAFGAKDFSLLAGDNYIPIGSLTIIGTGLLIGAQIWESAQNMKNGDAPIALEDVLDALSKITDPVFEQSMLSGLDSILSTLQNSADAGTGETATKIGIQILGNYIGQYVPSFVGRVASSLDKNQRSTYTEPNGVWAPIQGAVQGVQQKIPGLREQMAVRYGNWGVPVDGNGANGVGRAIFNAVTPVYPSKQKTDPVEEEIARLHDVNAEYSNFYKKPSKSIAVGREMVKLTSDQYAQYIETSGQTDYGIRAEMLESEIYKRVSDNVKSKAMSLSQEYANAIGKEAAGVGYESDDKWINELKGKSKEEIAEAILAKAISDEGYLSDDLQKQLDTVNGLYGSGAYVGTSPDLLEAAKRKAENYYRNVEKSKYGYELTDDEQALEGENQKVIAEHFLENAVADKYKDKNKDGTRMDEVLGAYRDGEISERLAMSTLEDKVVDAYADFGKEAGVTADMVLQTANAYARMKEEKDIDDVVTLSVEAQLDDWLDEQNWTDKQKEALRLGYYTNRVDSYNKLVEKLDNGSITVGEAKKGLTSKYQAAWTHEISHTGVDMQDYISALATYEGAPSADERDEMGFDYKWEWYCNELNKTDLTAEQKFAIVNATDDYAERTQKKIAQAVKATYIPTDSSGTGSGGGSYSSGGSSGGGYSSGYSSGWNSDDDEQNKLERAYERFGKNVGVTESMMQQAKDAKKKMYEIVDMDGKTVRSVEDQFDAWLANQSWTAEQKEAVRAGFYTDTVRNLQWLSANLRSGNISTAEAKFELSPTLQAGWSTNVLESGASMADYIDAITVFKQAPNEDGRKAIGYKTKWEWWCDKLNETSMTPEQKYAVAISVQEYADSTKKKIAKKLSWTGKKEDAAAKTSSIASTGDAFWDELARRLGHSLTQNPTAETTVASETSSGAQATEDEFWKELERRLGRPLAQRSETAQEQTYQIRTDTGYKEYLNLLAGRSDEYKASDGSVWTKGEDGEVYATKNGKSMRAEAVFDKADSSAQTRSSAAENAQEDGYTVNSPAGRLAYQMLENGVLTEWPATDGWTWKRTDSGIIAVKGKTRLPVLLAG